MSTTTITGQVPINNTIQVNVRPGDETGLYYILISNLPWQTSWQQLKDHVRTVCSSVERVEIFNESTSGWVSVRGRENYAAAMYEDLLETTPFNGRPIWADGRNAKSEIPIRRLVSTPAMTAAAPRSPRTPRTAPQIMQYPTSTPPMMSPTTSEYSHWSPGAPISIVSNPPTAYGLHPMPMVVTRNCQDAGNWYPSYDNCYIDCSSAIPTSMQPFPTEPALQYPQSNEFYGHDYTSMAAYTPGQDPKPTKSRRDQDSGQNVIQTERRKIIIKQLATWAQKDQIRGLLRSRCGFTGDEIQEMSIPQSKEGGNRGYATITFLSEDQATRARKKLHKHKFDGKPLDVDYTNEWVSTHEGSSRKHHHHSSNKEPREDKDKKDKPKASGSSQEKKEKPAKKGSIVIANGSTNRVMEGSKKSP